MRAVRHPAGDSLLFTVGLFVAIGVIDHSLFFVCVVLTVAAVLGNVTGYWIGRKIGPPLFKPRTGLMGKIFKQSYVDKTHVFFEKYGNRALILARFVPIVRTFVTLVAGVGKMDFRKFITYTAIGGVLWVCGITTLGYYLGTVPFIQRQPRSRPHPDRVHLGDPDDVGVRAAQAAGQAGTGRSHRADATHCRAVGRPQPTWRSANAARIGGRNCGALSGMVP